MARFPALLLALLLVCGAASARCALQPAPGRLPVLLDRCAGLPCLPGRPAPSTIQTPIALPHASPRLTPFALSPSIQSAGS